MCENWGSGAKVGCDDFTKVPVFHWNTGHSDFQQNNSKHHDI